jgi:putative SOS response-associated peptidase YedK
MPVVLAPDDCGAWLDPKADAADLQLLLKPYPAEATEAFPVSTLVNNVRNNRPECIEPAA